MRPSDYILPFGKHKGVTLDDVPASYFLWLIDHNWLMKFPEVQKYVEENYSTLVAEWQEDFDFKSLGKYRPYD